ncbi:MAG: recombinase family protein [Lachnospiraceae bacterium]|nr:recombinase family protein [Lachnospiraceae bacterium]MDE6253968.1 recombinase family protein [Lachnospiraceae bacterium]
MARKSRKQANVCRIESSVSETAHRVYRTALYARLSADEHCRTEGTTIENQLYIMRDYVEDKPYLQVTEEYFDDGITGTKFDRPSFNRMIDDMKSGKIDCIVVKDLSRLGRNYLEAGDYLERIFPFFGIRFIAITDGYDSNCPNLTEEGLIVPLKNLINDIYAKDLSRKISSAFYIKQKQGRFIGMEAPYGYLKSPADHNKLIVDEEVREVVWHIFHWRADGESLKTIVRRLNDYDIPCPGRYKYLKGWVKKERSKSGLWTVSTLARVLENPVYIGDMEQGINRAALYKGMKSKKMPVEERVYVKNTHEPIVEKEVFEKINEQRKKNREKYHSSYGKYDSISKEPNLLKGILVCADCGKNMSLWRDRSGIKLNPPRVYYKYICQTYQSLREKGCTRKRLNKKDIEKAVEEAIRLHIKLFLDGMETLEQLNRTERARQINEGYQREISEAIKRKSKAENRAGTLYNDYADGILSESDYLYAKEKYLSEAASEEQRIFELQEMQRIYEKGCKGNGKLKSLVEEYKNFDSLTEKIIQSFISKVLVYGDERLEICFRFKDEFEELIQVVEERSGEICMAKTQLPIAASM